ncbi:hypothetical protein BRC61_03695 [Halobacteriales archaeon QH_10_65_19]|nr:MAG: hypothetical protein BRC61_03695 [Halobacteriales archaeon QH_10_65_19]
MDKQELREEECFLRLDPDEIDDVDGATTTVSTAHEMQIVDENVPTRNRRGLPGIDSTRRRSAKSRSCSGCGQSPDSVVRTVHGLFHFPFSIGCR